MGRMIRMEIDDRRVQARLKRESLKGAVRSVHSVRYGGISVRGEVVDYAVYVHEDLTKAHPIGQAKFVEEPARTHRGPIGRAMKAELRRKRSVELATFAGAKVLLDASQPLVPVDTNRLKESGRIVKGR